MTPVSELFAIQPSVRFGDDFELDPQAYELRRAGSAVKLERIPLKILFLLSEHPGQLVSRERIVERVWGQGVHLDTDNSINGAVRKIRQVLGDSCEQPRFIQTVMGEGYRFMAPVQAPGQAPTEPAEVRAPVNPSAPDPAAVPSSAGPSPFLSFRLAVPLAIVAVLLVAIASYVAKRDIAATTPAAAPRSMLAVLPFENLTGDASQEYFSDGMTEEMIAKLGRMDPEHLGVIPRTSIMHYKGSRQPLDQIGRELGVQYIIEGSVRRDSQRVRITAELVRVTDQTHVWAREYDRGLKEIITVQDEIAQAISTETRRTLGQQLHLVSYSSHATTPASYKAYDLYLKGRYFWNKRTPEGFQQAATYFQQAIAEDPRYAPAYAGLADTYGLMSSWFQVDQREFMPKARAAALKAIELDDSLAEAHTSLALVAESYDYDWKTAEKEFRRALQLNPDYPTAHQWYAEFLSWQGRFDEAFAESERARQLDPRSLVIAGDHGAILYFSRQYDRALAHCRGVVEMDPGVGRCTAFMYYSYAAQGRFPEALALVERRDPAKDNPWTLAFQAFVYRQWGRDAEARVALAQVNNKAAALRAERIPVLLLAYSGSGAKAQELALLEEGYAEHSNALVALKVDPAYDPLRGDPQFQSLLHRLALD